VGDNFNPPLHVRNKQVCTKWSFAVSFLCLAHHAVRLWRSPRRWSRGVTNPWKSDVSFLLSCKNLFTLKPCRPGAELPNKHHRTNLHVRLQKSRNSALLFQSDKWVLRRKTHQLVLTGFLNRQCESESDNSGCRLMCVTLRSTPHWFKQNCSCTDNGVFESGIFEHVRLDELNARKKGKKKNILGTQSKARTGWPKRLRLVQANPWADFAVIAAQLWSTMTAIFSWVNNFAFSFYLRPRF